MLCVCGRWVGRFTLIQEVFELNRTGWLRRNVIGVTRSVLRFMFHGTVIRALHAGLNKVVAPDMLEFILKFLRELLWPMGQVRRVVHACMHAVCAAAS